MSYRSNIAYVIAFPNDEELASFLAQAKTLSGQPIDANDAKILHEQRFDNRGSHPAEWGRMDLALNECGVCWQKDLHQTPYIGFYAEGAKWYDGHQDVEAHESLVNLAIAHYYQGGDKTTYLNGTSFTCSMIAYQYLRIGEHEDDTTGFERGTSMMLGSFGTERKIWRTIGFKRATGGSDE